MDNTEIFNTLKKYRLIGKVAETTGVHRNTIKNVLAGETEDSMYLELVQTAARVAIAEKQMEINQKIEVLKAMIVDMAVA